MAIGSIVLEPGKKQNTVVEVLMREVVLTEVGK